MGLFDFVKDAGENLIERVSGKDDAVDTEGLEKAIREFGLDIENLDIRVEGDTAIVSGIAGSQASREMAVLMVGNNQGIARVDDRIQVRTPDVAAAPEPEPVFYTVEKGDSLSKIAKAQYGDAMKYPVIFEANRPMLEDPDKIYPGQVLRIPPLEE